MIAFARHSPSGSLPSVEVPLTRPFKCPCGAENEPALVAIWFWREDAVGGQNGEQHEQSRLRQSLPKQGRRNQRQARKHPDPNATEGLRSEFRSRLPRNRKAARGFAQAERDVAEPASPRS